MLATDLFGRMAASHIREHGSLLQKPCLTGKNYQLLTGDHNALPDFISTLFSPGSVPASACIRNRTRSGPAGTGSRVFPVEANPATGQW